MARGGGTNATNATYSHARTKFMATAAAAGPNVARIFVLTMSVLSARPLRAAIKLGNKHQLFRSRSDECAMRSSI